jgi:hypothetical protein
LNETTNKEEEEEEKKKIFLSPASMFIHHKFSQTLAQQSLLPVTNKVIKHQKLDCCTAT